MPQPGGLDDQDPLWIADMSLCLKLLAFQEQEYDEQLKGALNAQRGR
jgi:hypothetical protein